MIVVSFSGGLDSSVLLARAIAWRQSSEVVALSIDYGQRHARELVSAKAIAKEWGVEHVVLRLPQVAGILPGSALTDDHVDVPLGHYEAESMKTTVVPLRNLLFISIAAGYAEARGGGVVWLGAHAGDHPIYLDCRPEFVLAAGEAVGLATEGRVRVEAPYSSFRKEDIIREGERFGVPFDRTWSCYKGGKVHCGRCGTCVERREAFDRAGVDDVTEYERGS